MTARWRPMPLGVATAAAIGALVLASVASVPATPARCLVTRGAGDKEPWGGATVTPRCAVGGGGWVLTQVPNGSTTTAASERPFPPCDASPPSTVNTDLARCGFLPTPTLGFQDEAQAWVAWQDWRYTLDRVCFPSGGAGATTLLVAEQLDTIATVFVNGVEVGASTSTHVRFVADVTAAAKPGSCNNSIAVVLHSAIVAGRDLERRNEAAAAAGNTSAVWVRSPLDSDAPGCHPPLYPRDPSRVSNATRSPNDDGHIWIRKPTADYGWNWGPCFAAGGILAPVLVASFDASSPILEDVAPVVTPSLTGDGFVCELRVTVLAPPSTTEVTLAVSTGWGARSSRVYRTVPTRSAPWRHNVTVTLEVSPDAVELWWPRAMGAQRLYNVNVSVTAAAAGGSRAGMLAGRADQVVSPPPSPSSSPSFAPAISKRVGFRRVELVTSPGFSLRVNGHAVFAFGANVIPLSSFDPSFSRQQVDDLLAAAVNQGINLLRVWGGGDYMRPDFADTCDELGIMIWHDLSFNNGVYPSDSASLAKYAAEVAHQVARLGHHPSLILWCGNNEIEDSLEMLRSSEYQRINYATLIPALARADPTRPIWPCSPSNGFAEGHGPRSADPLPLTTSVSGSDPAHGDTHHYKYTGDCWRDEGDLPAAHMITEFGWPSYPSLETLAALADDADDLLANSTWITHRQDYNCFNGYDGNSGGGDRSRGSRSRSSATGPCLGPMLERFMNPPPGGWTSARADVFESWVHATQVLQAACIQGQAEHYRRGRERPEKTSGVVYWQLNSLYPWSSKSSVAHDNRRKALHYAAKRFFRRLHASVWFSGNGTVDSTTLHLHASNDVHNWTFPGGRVLVHAVDWKTGAASVAAEVDVPLLEAGSGAEVLSTALATLWGKSAACKSLSDCFVLVRPVATAHARAVAPDGQLLDDAFGFPAQFRNVSLARATVVASGWSARPDGSVSFVATADSVAAHVAFYTRVEGFFAPNALPVMMPGAAVNVTFTPFAGPVTIDALRGSLRTNCLNNIGACGRAA